MVKFQDEIDLHVATVEAYYSDPPKVLQLCKDELTNRDVENPAALLLMCTQKLTKIVESLTPTAQWHTQTEDTSSTEIVLLALSS
jgi:hypothetical protein